MNNIFVDYPKAKECKNVDAWFTCLKCGNCGRIFKDGVMINENGTHSEEVEEDDDG